MKNRQIKSKKAKQIIKKFEDEDSMQQDINDEEQEQQEQQESQEIIIKKTKQSIKQLLSKTLQKQVKNTENPILQERQELLKEIKDEKEKYKEQNIKKRLKKVIISKAHVDPRINNNKIFERSLKAIAAKGYVKLYQTIQQMREEEPN